MAALGDEQNTETVTYCPFDRLGAVVALYRFRIKRKTMRYAVSRYNTCISVYDPCIMRV